MIHFASLSMLLLNQSNLVKYMKLSSSLLGEAILKVIRNLSYQQSAVNTKATNQPHLLARC